MSPPSLCLIGVSFIYKLGSFQVVMAGQTCLLSCQGGLMVQCDRGLLLQHSPFLKELLTAEACICTCPILILPDVTVESVCLALNLLVGSTKEVQEKRIDSLAD